jgi:hypothetical protein
MLWPSKPKIFPVWPYTEKGCGFWTTAIKINIFNLRFPKLSNAQMASGKLEPLLVIST